MLFSPAARFQYTNFTLLKTYRKQYSRYTKPGINHFDIYCMKPILLNYSKYSTLFWQWTHFLLQYIIPCDKIFLYVTSWAILLIELNWWRIQFIIAIFFITTTLSSVLLFMFTCTLVRIQKITYLLSPTTKMVINYLNRSSAFTF